jgi:hypothetical protein
MKVRGKLAFIALLLPAFAFGQTLQNPPRTEIPAKSPLEVRISHFDVTDAVFRDGISGLSLNSVNGLHVGFEEIIRDKIQEDPRALSAHFSLHLEDRSVRQILDALCELDTRYTWSEDKASVNVYPRTTSQDPSYLPNFAIDHIEVNGIPDP